MKAFSGRHVTTGQISKILLFGNGITGTLEDASKGATIRLRAVPSGGALYPLELYYISMRTRGLPPGIYHYAALDHCLERILLGDFGEALAPIVAANLEGAAGVIVITAMFERTQIKYEERGYRFVLMEAGHAAQNVLLTAAGVGLGAIPVGGFMDDDVSRLLDLEGSDELPLYLIPVGHSSPAKANESGRRLSVDPVTWHTKTS